MVVQVRNINTQWRFRVVIMSLILFPFIDFQAEVERAYEQIERIKLMLQYHLLRINNPLGWIEYDA